MRKLLGCGSPNVMKVQLLLAELALDYSFEAVPLYGDALSDPAFRALNPNGRLPVLIENGVAIAESGAILIHLAERAGRFLPTDPTERAATFQWLMWQMAGVGPMFGQALHFRYVAGAGNDYAAGRYAREVLRLYAVAEARLSEAEWFAGAQYTIADIAIFPWMGRYAPTLGVDLAPYPHVRDWIGRIAARPACEAAAALNKPLFKSDLAAQAAAPPAELDRFFGR